MTPLTINNKHPRYGYSFVIMITQIENFYYYTILFSRKEYSKPPYNSIRYPEYRCSMPYKSEKEAIISALNSAKNNPTYIVCRKSIVNTLTTMLNEQKVLF